MRVGALRRFHRHLAHLALINHYDSTSEGRGAIDAFIKANSRSGFHPQTRLLRFRWLLDAANDVSYISRLEAPGVSETFLLDESSSQALVALGPWDDGSSAEMEALCPMVGDPAAVVLMEADDEVLIEKIRKREGERVTIAHLRMGQDERDSDSARSAEAARQVAQALERRGVEVIKVDAETSLTT